MGGRGVSGCVGVGRDRSCFDGLLPVLPTELSPAGPQQREVGGRCAAGVPGRRGALDRPPPVSTHDLGPIPRARFEAVSVSRRPAPDVCLPEGDFIRPSVVILFVRRPAARSTPRQRFGDQLSYFALRTQLRTVFSVQNHLLFRYRIPRSFAGTRGVCDPPVSRENYCSTAFSGLPAVECGSRRCIAGAFCTAAEKPRKAPLPII